MSWFRGTFFWKLFLGNAALLIIVVSTCVWLILDSFEQFHSSMLTSHLRAHAELIAQQVSTDFSEKNADAINRCVREDVEHLSMPLRITIITEGGTVLAETQTDPDEMENHADRLEFRQAIERGWGESTRWSHTLSRHLKYIAVRVGTVADPKGVVRVSLPLQTVTERAQSAKNLFLMIGLVVFAAAIILALGLAKLWSQPLANITNTARSISRGDLSARASVSGSDEVALLGRSLNQMRHSLATQLATINRQHRTLASLMTQLHEGVIVAGPDGRIVLLNPAAAKMLEIPITPDDNTLAGTHQLVEACVSNHVLQEMLVCADSERRAVKPSARVSRSTPFSHADRAEESPAHAQANDDTSIQEARLTLDRPTGVITVLARASSIVLPAQASTIVKPATKPAAPPETERDAAHDETGRLLVLTDITELAHTIQVKTDFAANASHELRTPLAAIRAAVETLMDTPPADDPEGIHRLAAIIERHAGRLEAMARDLLALSQLEAGAKRIQHTLINLDVFIADLRDRFEQGLARKRIHWAASIDPGCRTVVSSRHLLQLIMDNLVDNAVKFTEENGRVSVVCTETSAGFAIAVKDTGCGIPKEDHHRVFERFYQVERARSGAGRGTGLGLSIVRHAVNSLQGTIKLESEPGEGTSITISIPLSAVSRLQAKTSG